MSTVAGSGSAVSGQSSLYNAGRNTGELGKDDFLKLLAAQMRHQDPLSPMTDYSFIAQLAQFSSLEQVSNVGDEMRYLRATMDNGQQRANALSALSLVGMQARVLDSDNSSVSGTIQAVRLLGTLVYLNLAGKEYDAAGLQEVWTEAGATE
jgi:flagellar basal-body rod modification protein FlgD